MKYDIVKLMARRKIRWKKRWVSGDSGGRLTFRSKKAGRLSDYRIYGNTVGGESVGDRTANLFDISTVTKDQFINAKGIETSNETIGIAARLSHSDFIAVPSGNYITMQYTGDVLETHPGATLSFCWYNANKSFITRTEFILNNIWNDTHTQYTMSAIVPEGISYCIVNIAGYNNTNRHYMLNSGSTPLPYEPYGYKVPVTVEGKNLINPSVYEIHNTGVEYTVNNDKSITANGSTSSTFSLFLVKVYLTKGSYIISGCPQNGSQNTYRCEIRDTVLTSLAQDTGAGVTYSIVTDGYYYYSIRIAQNYVCDNITFYPMIRKADIEDDTYEPYHVPVTTPIYLPEQIRKVGDEAEYISYAEQKQHRIGADDIDVTLPALPTLTGTNVLSVGTAVQPSRVEVKGRIKAVGQEPEAEPETAEPEQETAEPEQEAAEPEQEEPEVKEDDTDDR